MSIVSNVNILSTNAATEGVATCLYYLKETLKSAGWKVLTSSNGTTLTGYLTGTVGADSITSVSVMNSASAWYRITDPDSAREFVFMRGSTATTAVIKYSKASKFAYSGSAALLPTTNGGDGAILLSTQTTDAAARSGSHGTTFMTTSGITNSRFHFITDNSATNSTYPWYMFGLQTTTNTILCMYSHEAVAAGSYSSSDSDPSWFITAANATDLTNIDGAGQAATFATAPGKAWYKYSLSGSAFEKAIGLSYLYVNNSSVAVQTYPANLGTNPYDSKDTGMPFLVRSVNFPKGISTGLRYRGVLRTYPDLISYVYLPSGQYVVLTPNDDWYVYLDKLLVPWPSGSTPTTTV